MNADERERIRNFVLAGPSDSEQQLAWCQESLVEHLRIEQRTKARFRLADFCGDVEQMKTMEKDMKEIRASIGFLETEIARLKGVVNG